MTGGPSGAAGALTPARRVSVSVGGIVQGIGFRPFVHGVASALGLAGFVRNERGGVLIEIEGREEQVATFMEALRHRPPPLAKIEQLRCTPLAPQGTSGFRIDRSDEQSQAETMFFAPDVATCEACLHELFDPRDRRYRYPFITCAACGPRLTVVRGGPYDRERTTMAMFRLCEHCRGEYQDPHDRRFHAQSIACADCGPRLTLHDAQRGPVQGDAVTLAADHLRRGSIIAIKGLGGYHLACDAESSDAVASLRAGKRRDGKPFAVMVADLATADRLCEVSESERQLLSSPPRPIVLMRKRGGAQLAPAVAPGQRHFGLLLPYTPVHHLLMRELAGRTMVLTSANVSDQPIAFEDADALARLGQVAAAFLVHDRSIHVPCEDSLLRVLDGQPVLLRRARGYAPEPVPLPRPSQRKLLALGGQLKSTFALGRQGQAFISQHLGDLGERGSFRSYRSTLDHYLRLFSFSPDCVVHDLHPGYATGEVSDWYRQAGVELMGVQHHHAHMASCMADNGLPGPVIGVVFDGSGDGGDGSVWGGEFLVGDYQRVRRAAHLRAVALPGGEAAIRQPWRMALSHLLDAGQEPSRFLLPRVSPTTVALVRRLVERGLNCPLTSSVGRLFDAVASLLGLRDRVQFEGQAAMQLETLAEDGGPGDDAGFPFELQSAGQSLAIDSRPMIAAIAQAALAGQRGAIIAWRFHHTLAAMIDQVARRLRDSTGIDTVVLTGGVFMNQLLLRSSRQRLRDSGFSVHGHRRVPCNDGGLSYGQLAVAAARLQSSKGTA